MKNYFLATLFLTSLATVTGLADEPPHKILKNEPAPWLTGPLLAPSGHTIPAGHVNYEPYFYFTENQGRYNSHWDAQTTPRFTTALLQPTFQIGVAKGFEFDIAPQTSWNHTKHVSTWVLNDLPVTFAFQLLKDQPGKWWPAIKLRLAANIPIGKFQKLSSHKLGTDSGGSGNWSPAAGLVFSHLYHLSGVHFLATRGFISYSVSTPVHVKGLNTYGGSVHTRGTVYPGNTFQTICSFEYTMTQNWAFAMDTMYQHANKTRFSGQSGGTSLKKPSSEQFSIAPALEYNWNENVGLIGGSWFSLGGRNSTRFVSWVLAFNLYV